MNIDIKLADRNDFFIVKNFIPFFRDYLGYVYEELPNKYGVFDNEDCMTLQQSCNKRDKLIERSNEFFPYIIFIDDKAGGYIIVAKGESIGVPDCDYFVNALFLVRTYRRKGISSYVMRNIFDLYHGKWELYTSKSNRNVDTQEFWRNMLDKYTKGNFQEELCLKNGYEKLRFTFDNSKE